ncbi:MAG: UDP-glucose 4-epimerase GalE [Oscillospiraceae bacterium]|nr:UDP-glucose 4-epimerase GalE [Oscillospiraceae bacterium]
MSGTILLTGAAGYIGSHTAVALAQAGYDLAIVDNCSNSSPIAVERCRELTGADIPFYQADVADKEALMKIFRQVKPAAVMHFSGYKAVGESVAKPLSYYRNNLDTTLTLLECMVQEGVGVFIFSSSATVYGAGATVPYRESDPVGGCTNPYGWTKLMIEQIARDTAAANPNMSVVLLRYFNPVGAHESGRIGENPAGIPNNLMPYITQVAVGKLDHLNIFGNDYDTPDGTGVRDYIHVMDLAQGHVAALDYAMKHTGTEIFNLGTGKGVSVLELVNAFQAVNGVAVPYEFAPRRAGDLASVWADPTKAKELLGWTAEKTVEDMVADSWRWQKNNPNGYV